MQDRRASFRVGDAMALPFGDETFSAVVSGLVLNFIPRQDVALAEMVRVAKRGGIVAAYVWDYAGQMQMLRVFWDAAVEWTRRCRERTGPPLPYLQAGASH